MNYIEEEAANRNLSTWAAENISLHVMAFRRWNDYHTIPITMSAFETQTRGRPELRIK